MDIKVLGAGCPDCDKLYANTVEAVKAAGLDVEVEKIDKLADMVRLGVMTSPAIWIDGKLLFAGQVPKAKAIEKKLREL